MTIEIHQPELEALIQRRMATGCFGSVEDVLLQAMKALPDMAPSRINLADFLLASPLPGSDLQIDRAMDQPKPVDL